MTTPSTNAFLANGPRRGKGRKRSGAQALAPTRREPSRQQPAPVRACVSCRRPRPQPELLQLAVAPPGTPPAGAGPHKSSVKAGRNSYVCTERACLVRLSERLPQPESAQLLASITAMAKARFVGMLGLCRRQGELLVGAGRITDPKIFAEDLAIYAACDLASRTHRQLQRCGEVVDTMLDAAALGHAVGQTNVGAVGILPGRLGDRAAYWLHVWYEAKVVERPASEPRQAVGDSDGPTAPATLDLMTDEIEVAR